MSGKTYNQKSAILYNMFRYNPKLTYKEAKQRFTKYGGFRKQDVLDLLRGWKAGTGYKETKKHTHHTLKEQTKTIRIRHKGEDKSASVHLNKINTRNANFVQLETPKIEVVDPDDFDTYLEAG